MTSSIDKLRELTDSLNKKDEEIFALSDRFDMVRSLSGIGFWSWNISNNKLIWDDNWYKIFEVTKETFGHTYDDFIALLHPDDVIRIQEALTTAKILGTKYEVVYRIICPGNTQKLIAAQGRISDREMCGVCLDLTTTHAEKDKYINAMLFESKLKK